MHGLPTKLLQQVARATTMINRILYTTHYAVSACLAWPQIYSRLYMVWLRRTARGLSGLSVKPQRSWCAIKDESDFGEMMGWLLTLADPSTFFMFECGIFP